MCAKNIDFVIAASQVIEIEKIGIVLILPLGRATIDLYNIALALHCDLKLISLGQFWQNEIMFYDNAITMTLMPEKKIVVHHKRE